MGKQQKRKVAPVERSESTRHLNGDVLAEDLVRRGLRGSGILDRSWGYEKREEVQRG